MCQEEITAEEFSICLTSQKCWKCERTTTVIGLKIWEPEEDTGNGVYVMPYYIDYIDKESLADIHRVKPDFQYLYSKSYEGRYYMNCCDSCKAQQGDHFLHEEFDNPFEAPFEAEFKITHAITIVCDGHRYVD